MGRQPTSETHPACLCRAQAGVGRRASDGEEYLGPHPHPPGQPMAAKLTEDTPV